MCVTVIGRTAAICILGADMHVWTVKCTNSGFNEYVKSAPFCSFSYMQLSFFVTSMSFQ